MALSAVYYAPGVTISHMSGRTYKADSTSGLLTVPYVDAATVAGISADYILRYLTGTTADRLSLNPTGPDQPGPPRGLMFWDTTLATACFYVGAAVSTYWIDYQGNVV